MLIDSLDIHNHILVLTSLMMGLLFKYYDIIYYLNSANRELYMHNNLYHNLFLVGWIMSTG